VKGKDSEPDTGVSPVVSPKEKYQIIVESRFDPDRNELCIQVRSGGKWYGYSGDGAGNTGFVMQWDESGFLYPVG